MTRTERATSPRAILKDRSESKTGMDKHTPKGGAGPHNWGSLMNERDLEDAAEYDRDVEQTEAQPPRPKAETRRKSSASVTDEDREKALQFRKNALKSPNVDLASIARTSAAVSTSPPSATPVMSAADTTK
ncbi:hypothetical protein NM688_g2365 [Phlebia brevispora]|uniref:Uncharacterized protein n=1 Tax=Phlebia brevispora TaxID=194682 RepID=A0ACC1T8N8_9APHY|nr:hypothetical protein NM688_g2365 [Phlebia brevispora]